MLHSCSHNLLLIDWGRRRGIFASFEATLSLIPFFRMSTADKERWFSAQGIVVFLMNCNEWRTNARPFLFSEPIHWWMCILIEHLPPGVASIIWRQPKKDKWFFYGCCNQWWAALLLWFDQNTAHSIKNSIYMSGQGPPCHKSAFDPREVPLSNIYQGPANEEVVWTCAR